MNHKTASENLEIIASLLKEWEAEGDIGQLEYEILLDRIKSLYVEVKFCSAAESEDVATSVLSVQTSPSLRERPVRNDTAEPEVSGHRQTVRALYGDDTTSPNEKFSVSPEQDIKEESTCSNSDYGLDSRSEETGKQTPVNGSSSSRQVLGEVIGSCGPTVADRLNASTVDVVGRIGHEKVSSLRGCIGLNDRYMFIRDLFNGDHRAYEEAIDTLDGCGSIEDALIYIHDNFDWKADSPAADALCSMLFAKLL